MFNLSRTAESVSKFHPDKICDQISDLILDEILEQDPLARVAVDCFGGHNKLYIMGEITSSAQVDVKRLATEYYEYLTGQSLGEVVVNLVEQAPEISNGVNTGGAGDQGIMVGYACNENESFIPQELFLARKFLERTSSDAKSQVTLDDRGRIQALVLSIEGADKFSLNKRKDRILNKYEISPDFSCYLNNTGSFDIGGFDADTGLTGRKIVVDQYGPRVSVGGGAFSGKDSTKVDRSGAYMARWIALKLLNKYGADEVTVQLGYVIGKSQPVMKQAIIKNGKKTVIEKLKNFDCTVTGIMERFELRRPIYLQTARQGHFGFKNYPWEKI